MQTAGVAVTPDFSDVLLGVATDPAGTRKRLEQLRAAKKDADAAAAAARTERLAAEKALAALKTKEDELFRRESIVEPREAEQMARQEELDERERRIETAEADLKRRIAGHASDVEAQRIADKDRQAGFDARDTRLAAAETAVADKRRALADWQRGVRAALGKLPEV